MRVGEDSLDLYRDSHQAIYVEKTPIDKFLFCCLPVGEPIVCRSRKASNRSGLLAIAFNSLSTNSAINGVSLKRRSSKSAITALSRWRSVRLAASVRLA